jgi:hypothetical protein
VTWHADLLCLVFLADLLVFVALCRDELRDWSAGRQKPGMAPVGHKTATPGHAAGMLAIAGGLLRMRARTGRNTTSGALPKTEALSRWCKTEAGVTAFRGPGSHHLR